jgi:hypothetical protein
MGRIKPSEEKLERTWTLFLGGMTLKRAAQAAGLKYHVAWNALRHRPGYAEAMERNKAVDLAGRVPKNKADVDDEVLLAAYLDGGDRHSLAERFSVSHNTVYNRLRRFPEFQAEAKRRKAGKASDAWKTSPNMQLPPPEVRKAGARAFWKNEAAVAERRRKIVERHGVRFIADLPAADLDMIVSLFRKWVSIRRIAKLYGVQQRGVSRHLQERLDPAEFERLKAEIFERRFTPPELDGAPG